MGRYRNNHRSGFNGKYRSPLPEYIIPRTEVCWFWLNRSCRFTDKECRDLHEWRENTAGFNYRDGQITSWQSIVDLVDEVPPPRDGQRHKPARDPSTTWGKVFTCYFWHRGFCRDTEAKCKYLHTYVGSEGIFKAGLAHFASQRWRDEELHPEKYRMPKRQEYVDPALVQDNPWGDADPSAPWPRFEKSDSDEPVPAVEEDAVTPETKSEEDVVTPETKSEQTMDENGNPPEEREFWKDWAVRMDAMAALW